MKIDTGSSTWLFYDLIFWFVLYMNSIYNICNYIYINTYKIKHIPYPLNVQKKQQ